MVQVKKISKYGKYFLLLALASAVSFVWPSKSSEQSSLTPTIPQAHADVPVGNDPSDPSDPQGDGDCDDGGDCT